MGISEREYKAMLAGNPELVVADDPGAVTPAQLVQLVRPAAPAPTEHEEQAALFAWAAANEGARPELGLMFAVPNGGYRPMATAAMLRAEGVRAGVPDVFLPIMRRAGDGRIWGGLFIEMKRRPNKPTPEQAQWIAALRVAGYMAVVCWSAQEAIDVITNYLDQA
jgi:hypothetical protein